MITYFERFNTAPPNRLLIAYCPEWNDEGYQVCKYDERGFYYHGQPNDEFDRYVTHWGFLGEIE